MLGLLPSPFIYLFSPEVFDLHSSWMNAAAQCTAFHLNLPLCLQAKDLLAKDPTLLLCNTLGRAVYNCHELYSG